MAIHEKLYTADEFWEMIPLLVDGKQYELVEGRLIEMPPSSPTNSKIALRIGRYLDAFVEEHHLGHVLGADGGYTLSPGNVRIPDVSFVSNIRVPELPKHLEGAPDLAVEVISPSETVSNVNNKVKLFLEAGAKRVWLVYPEEQVVDICRPAEDGMHVQRLTADDSLDGGDVLPGFSLSLRKIFPDS